MQTILPIEANLEEHVAFLQRRLPGMTVEDSEDLLLVDSGLPTDTFNKILRARLTENNADRRIAEAIGYFRAAGRPFAWWVGPGSCPLDLERRLQAHGLKAAESELGMAAKLGGLPQRFGIPGSLDIQRVRSAAELADFASVSAANWDPPDPAVLTFFEMGAPVLLDENCPMRLFVGYVDGTAAAASELFVGAGVAGIHMISTRAAFRGRGIGSAMTWAAADEGRRLGLAIATRQASEEGRGVYTRLGFEPCCHFIEYQ